MLFFSLLSCVTEPAPRPEPAAEASPAADPALPEGAGTDWFSTVQSRIAAEGRAIHPRDGAFAADLPSLGLDARLDADGVVISGEEGEALALRTTAWGREGALVPLEAREPAMGACTSAVDAAGDCIRRLEYAEPELTEWWIGLGTGLEQGWTVDVAPRGEGLLVLEVAVDGALSVEGGGEDATITDAHGRAWNVGSISAFDADGEPLPARVVATEDGLRIEVDDAGAVYPVEIDPVYTTAAWTGVGGGAAGGGLGYRVSGVGDVNGDSFADVAVSTSDYRRSHGAVYVYLGSSSGLGTSASTAWTGESANESFGYGVSGAGDVNGDGFDDVVVGAYGYGTYVGRAQVYHGSASGLGDSPSTTLTGESTYSFFGYAVSGAGDVNGDGYDDVVAGAWNYGSGAGRAYVYLGSSSGLSTSASTTWTGESASSSFGIAVSSAGDVDGDGYDDVVVGASGYSSSTGRAYVYLGSSSGLGTSAITTWTGESTSSAFGTKVASAGDVNGDGYDDVVVGAFGYSSSTGRAYVYLGSSTGLGTSASTTWTGASTSNAFGTAVSGAGDVNGDGYDDVVVGAYAYSSYTGRAYVYLGASSGLATSASTTWTGESTSNYFGAAVSGAGDVNGDGYDDVVVGAYGYNSTSGRAYVYLGSSSGLGTSASTTWTGETTSNYFGGAVSDAGDVNGDGYDDVVIGAWSYGTLTGRAYVYHGSSSGLATSASTTLTGESTYTYFGLAVSGAGDVNGDGYDDVVVGAHGYSSYTGRAYVYLGSSSGIVTSAAATWTGESTLNRFGASVSGAGDVNRDGYDDVMVGAYYYSSGTGRVYVYLGSSSGLGASASRTLTGSGFEQFGSAVSGAGDVNGDGYDDVVVGADGSAGRAYVYEGSSSGLGTSAATTLSGGSTSTYTGFGDAVSAAGDVNGDGYDDVVVGASYYSSYTGRAYVYLGSASGLGTSVSTTLTGESASSYFGAAVSGAGDVNADGYDDVIVGAWYHSTGTGRVYLYHGSSIGLGSSASTTLTGDGTYNYFGYGASGAGDVDGDGYDDVIVGAYSASTAYLYLGYADADADGVAAADDCDDTDATVTSGTTLYTDADGDGYGSSTTGTACAGDPGFAAVDGDCDDTDAAINPGAAEACDAADTDEDCDGLDDDDDSSATGQSTFFADTDRDGYGGTTTGSYCDLPSGYTATSTDCDDTNAAISPAATELCDSADTDEDCDGLADDDDSSAAGQSTFYADADSDGYGGTTAGAYCDLPAGYTATSTDCDDGDAAIHPGATELCDSADTDEDCDGLADDDDSSATGQSSFYRDADRDGYGGTTTGSYCDLPSGYTATSTDCDDTNAAISPAATELCDSADTDEDCDGLADDADASATGKSTFYADVDSDGYGGTTTGSYCDLPSGYTATSTDCDDSSSSTHPGATDAAGDAVDADCDGTESCYVDADEDGARTAYQVASTDTDCSDVGEALSSAATDCDDGDAASYPGATELVADEVDQDCDGGETCYVDGDGDGYLADTSTVASTDADCTDAGEAAATALSGDCDDGDAAFNPAAAEPDCTDPADYNCDGSVAWADADSDGWAACAECDDGDATVNPDAIEIPGDGVDGDCDGVDRCYVDADGDGYRTTDVIDGTTVACDGVGEAAVTAAEDCDDGDATVSPAATDTVGDELDQDCDGAERCWADADGDAVRASDVVDSSDTDCTDPGEAPSSAADGDCDDTDPTVSPFASEQVADGIDQDCDGGDTCYADTDEDGYAAADGSTVTSPDLACDAPGEAAVAGDDCDDTDAATNPDAEELVGDEIDEDCDGAERCYADADADGYTDGSDVDSVDTDCADAGEAAATALSGDCDDTDAAYNPAAAETDCADPADYNCDGSSGYTDADGDGFAACEECDDADAAVNPDAVELAGDAVDQDCDLAEDCYVDADGDGARLEDLVTSTDADCGDAGEALASADLDCDDAEATVSPSATETAGDGIDANCDGLESCYVDADGDGYAPDGGATVESADADCADAGEATDTTPTGDCDDTSVAFSPGADESDCTDPADYNCDGSSGYADTDGDGFAACEECDDALGTVNPDADEVCNGVDDDCDGGIDVDASDATTWYADTDGDGYTDPDVSTLSCDAPDGYVAATEDDCDDEDAAAFPGADEVPDDGVDQDCDGVDLVTDDDDDSGTTEDSGKRGGDEDPGCGCQAGGPAASLAGIGLLLLAVGRRRS